MMTASRIRPRLSAGAFLLLVLTLPLVSGCDDESLTAPEVENDLFNSYVAFGNSITAGFQSGGINSQTQSESYAVLLSEQMKTQFTVPRLSLPGCPPPLQSIPPQPSSTQCELRSPAASKINNVAVPGASLSDVLSNSGPGSSPNQLTQLILGGRTQVAAALDANPTFATVWIGNNDVLRAANAGDPTLATSPKDFETRYRAIADSLINKESLEGAGLIGVADVSALPGIFSGQVYLGLAQQAGDQLPDNFSVSQTCAPDNQGGRGSTNQISFLFALDLINQARQSPDDLFTLSCLGDDPGVLTPAELSTLSSRTGTYNDIISSIADKNEWAFYNPRQDFEALKQAGEIPQMPDFTSDQPPFGRFFSLDGVHPSALTHRVVADQLIQAINKAYLDEDEDLSRLELENVPPLPAGNGQ
ncbi:lysophospholipase L1-like esterase [Salinibacter ruber]|uniref:SGNH/GDSL hydrolase family protein n=1 Tax=Salinibacter ruber TaxID=146919 RepID=UPI00216AA731|nr:SGNH/GDSL hydrolase family protein [Salinibacter ruber]MCS3630313.1 lysophospholipase L1-like esterase [Salinibacter ruber]